MDLKKYLNNSHQINGWCNPKLWNCIQPIHNYHKENNINYPIAEIGVYQGKFFCGLGAMVDKNAPHLAIDVFSLQKFNLDKAGEGNLKLFKENLSKCDLNNVEIIEADSLTIKQSFINSKSQQYSYVSVDACHLPEHTINDFKIAMELVIPEGIIFVDDYYNPNWPGVQEGISKYYLNNYSNFIPFLYTCNKLFFCHYGFHKIYLDIVTKFIKNNYTDSKIKLVNRFGFDSLTVLPNNKSKTYVI